ncbi:hypothetical protein [Vibrio sonorensis]|uniref:hypothetical protein n=1 Tax=Vibrio sonorensis TaxID=1004316 RepID=UPI0008DA9A76|nr:hypothetical protein [Vibrio sonorensis]
MTPASLLESVKQRFSVLLNTDTNQFNVFLRQALQTYEASAGCWKVMRLESAESPLPSDYKEKIICRDRGRYHVSVFVDEVNKTLIVENPSRASFPCDFIYYTNLSGVDLDTYELPNECEHLVSKYLYVLIAIPEFERQARISAANNYDTSAYPSQAELQAQKTEIETEMRNQMVLPNVRVR